MVFTVTKPCGITPSRLCRALQDKSLFDVGEPVALSVNRWILEVEVRGLEPALGSLPPGSGVEPYLTSPIQRMTPNSPEGVI